MKQEIDNEEGLAKILKRRRKELEITQKELASVCNLSHNGISRIEVADSDIKLSTLLKMGKFLRYKVILEMDEE
ncbi:MAG: helix-turn-helix transcriptional regulator [Bacteriovoracaceae bacterium]|nr:helix-turn-helix transcriptional regulator [Bacteriovoracaceae bacterium]